MAGPFVNPELKVFRGHSVTKKTNGRMCYEAFKVELERRDVDISSQKLGVSGWFRDVQEAGGDFKRYLDLVGAKVKFMRKTHEEAIAIIAGQ